MQVLLRDEMRKRGKPEAYVKDVTARNWLSWALRGPADVERRIAYVLASRCHPGNTAKFLWALADQVHLPEARKWLAENKPLLAEHLLLEARQ